MTGSSEASRVRCAPWSARLWRDERGAVAVYSAITMAALVGFAGLVLDVSRFTVTETELQYAADAGALAGAAELDGKTTPEVTRDAITRATDASRTAFVQNLQTHATGSANVDIPAVNIRFFSAIDTPPGTDIVTTDPTAARFIEVTTAASTVNNLLIQVVGGPASETVQARAVAGFTQAICRSTPLMICNPNETSGSVNAGFDGNAWKGREIVLKQQGANTQWAPGNFGLLEPKAGNGAIDVKKEIATPNPTACYGTAVDLKTGSVNSVDEAFNVRFDIYPNGGAFSSPSTYPPARNVTKGDEWKLQGSQQPNPLYQKLPRDTCLVTGTCGGNYGARIGDGTWDYATYWTKNHPSVTPPATLGATPTRYEVYRYELEYNKIPDNTAIGGENGNPTNATAVGVTPSAGCPAMYPDAPNAPTCTNDISDVDRRRLVMAVVNCLENNVKGAETNLPVVDFVDLFMTEAVKKGVGQEVVVEVIGSAGEGSLGIAGTMRDIVQLYR